jgi:hypothetical protein
MLNRQATQGTEEVLVSLFEYLDPDFRVPVPLLRSYSE